jgi:hypothetical protein
MTARWDGGGGKPMRLEALDAAGDLISGIELHSSEPYARVTSPRGAAAAPAAREHVPSAVTPPKKAEPTEEQPGKEEEDDPFDFVE